MGARARMNKLCVVFFFVVGRKGRHQDESMKKAIGMRKYPLIFFALCFEWGLGNHVRGSGQKCARRVNLSCPALKHYTPRNQESEREPNRSHAMPCAPFPLPKHTLDRESQPGSPLVPVKQNPKHSIIRRRTSGTRITHSLLATKNKNKKHAHIHTHTRKWRKQHEQDQQEKTSHTHPCAIHGT